MMWKTTGIYCPPSIPPGAAAPPECCFVEISGRGDRRWFPALQAMGWPVRTLALLRFAALAV